MEGERLLECTWQHRLHTRRVKHATAETDAETDDDKNGSKNVLEIKMQKVDAQLLTRGFQTHLEISQALL